MARPPRSVGTPSGSPPPGAAPDAPPPPPPPPPSNPPVQLILVSESARFRMGPAELRYEWGAIDTGIVSQNISLFCAATGLKTRPRASMDKEK
jgi:nitroreductase